MMKNLKKKRTISSKKINKFHLMQSGASLVTLMAMLTVITIGFLAVAPNLYTAVQREKEVESIRRGEEVAEAIRQFVVHYNGQKLPNSIDELLEGLPQGTKKRQILRTSAAIDPLAEDGKWRLIKPNTKELINFQRRVFLYNDKVLPTTPNQQFFQRFIVQLGAVSNIEEASEGETESSFDGDDDTSENSTESAQFIGVASQSTDKSVIAYYGIEKHNRWVFTPLFRGFGQQNNQPNPIPPATSPPNP